LKQKLDDQKFMQLVCFVQLPYCNGCHKTLCLFVVLTKIKFYGTQKTEAIIHRMKWRTKAQEHVVIVTDDLSPTP